MNTQEQVCTPEQAKKLKELGVVGEVEYYFRGGKIWHFNEVTDWPNQEQLYDLIASGDEGDSIIPAYTVAELGVMLPKNYYTLKASDIHEMEKGDWHCISQRMGEPRLYGQTEAEARAAMLIHLLENNLTTAEEVNNRLNT